MYSNTILYIIIGTQNNIHISAPSNTKHQRPWTKRLAARGFFRACEWRGSRARDFTNWGVIAERQSTHAARANGLASERQLRAAKSPSRRRRRGSSQKGNSNLGCAYAVLRRRPHGEEEHYYRRGMPCDYRGQTNAHTHTFSYHTHA